MKLDDIKVDKDWKLKVFASLSFPTLILRPDGVIIAANNKFLEKVNAKESEIVGNICSYVSQEWFPKTKFPCKLSRCPLKMTVRDGKGHSILTKIDGGNTTFWEDRVFSPILNERNEVAYVIESIRDVTRSKTIERMFKGVRKFLDNVIQSSVSAILASDFNGKILLMNEAAESLFKNSLKSSRQLNIHNFFSAETYKDITGKLRNKNYGGEGRLSLTKVEIIAADGEIVPTEMTAAVIREDSREIAIMGVYNDLRPRIKVENRLRKAEAQVIQSEKMASLGRLAAGIAHEINNPLTGILLYGHMSLEKAKNDKYIHEKLGFILEDAERCKEIVKQLLAYSRQNKTNITLLSVNSLVSVNNVVNDSLKLIRDQKLFINVSLKRSLSRQDLLINVDENQVRQALINLIMNALDAMQYNGVLELKTFLDHNKNVICIDILDTGTGIPAEHRDKIFEPFFTTKELGKGTGLGLSTAYGIISENKGNIFLKNTSNKGTVFRIEFLKTNS